MNRRIASPGRLARNRPLAIAAGLVLDRLTPEPPDELHPVAWFGNAMQRLEEAVWQDSRWRGSLYAGIGVIGAAAIGSRSRSLSSMISITSAGPQLRQTAAAIGEKLAEQDLDGARALLPSLCGRDPSQLDESGIAAATIESLAENTVDALVAPVFWAAVGGAPAAAAYRAINTMDAMVGHRNERHSRFGWASARLDDAANWLPARIYAGLVAVQEPSTARRLLELVRRDAPDHPSPNAGVAETAMAAAVGRKLGGPLRYGMRRENRPQLGEGPRPQPDDIQRAIAVTSRVEWTITAALAAIGVVQVWRSRR